MHISLKDFSTYRPVLMGVAILFIMASHTIGRFGLYGNIGVEWFLIASAIGQFFSLKKDDDTLSYFKRRLVRLLPAYLIVTIPFFLIRYPFSLGEYLIRLSGLNLIFLWERTFWFVSLIFICYLIAPFYYKVIVRYKTSFIIPFILTAIIFPLSFHLPRTEILVTRIPIFLLGMNLGKLVYEDRAIDGIKKCMPCYIAAVVAMAAVVLVNYIGVRVQYQRLTYFFCGIPSLFFILWIVRNIPFVQKPLAFLGSISYEIYLLHESIVFALCLKLPVPKLVSAILSYVIAVSLAYLLHRAVNAIVKPAKR